ncbi:MAG: hypothetical protein EXQ85_02125 [Alphaproteobacteria bacterium]|nr:hypothetical protein [Alphaproteobacteria bacterium]
MSGRYRARNEVGAVFVLSGWLCGSEADRAVFGDYIRDIGGGDTANEFFAFPVYPDNRRANESILQQRRSAGAAGERANPCRQRNAYSDPSHRCATEPRRVDARGTPSNSANCLVRPGQFAVHCT